MEFATMQQTAQADALVTETFRALATPRFPTSTYRVQLHGKFTFRDAAAIVPYLRQLGISHFYASPYLKARPGSMHGYDITDHRELNPEIGSAEDYEAFQRTLAENGLAQVLDIVPNHMGILGNENPWWNDVLENGPASRYAGYFDISWDASPRPELQGRLLLPVLGDSYGKVLESGQLRLQVAAGALEVTYFEHRFPIDVGTYVWVLAPRLEELAAAMAVEDPALVEFHSILTAIRNLPSREETAPERRAERQREKEVIKRRLAQLCDDSVAVREYVARCVEDFNGQPGDSPSFNRLDQLLDEQPYRLAFWRVATDEINYRRFFDINELAALSMERDEVFQAAHEMVLRLLSGGGVDGLRIDHPDGLFNPHQYLRRLQTAFVVAYARDLYESRATADTPPWGEQEPAVVEAVQRKLRAALAEGRRPPLYVLVEKILGHNEALPHDWPIYGTSGYNFLNMLNGLFVDDRNQNVFAQLYSEWIDCDDPFADVIYSQKTLILRVALASELYMLAHRLDRLAQKTRWTRDYTLTTLRHALRETIACFPVYRSYIAEGRIDDADRAHVHHAIRRAKARSPAISPAVFNFVQDMLLLHYPDSAGEADREEQRQFVGKFEQVTAPVTAKGVEDTAFYIYNRLLALNEVGGDPGRFGLAPAELHRYLADRQRLWPYGMSTTTTHDTKRSEDVRARLGVLSEMPEQWRALLSCLRELSQPHMLTVENAAVPDPNEEYLIYQTLLGAWPLEPYTADEFQTFISRIQQYMTKALNEAKVHSSWINPNEEYDAAMRQFLAAVLADHDANPFVAELRPLVRYLSRAGMVNSLAQVLVKIAAPGVPDIYQGNEVWDFSLVDPDNRRPVDYELRRKLLEQLDSATAREPHAQDGWLQNLLACPQDGRLKMWVTVAALRERQRQKELFTVGEYIPLEVTGIRERHLFAFARRQRDGVALVVVPRLVHGLLDGAIAWPLGEEVWSDTAVRIPGDLGVRPLVNVFTGKKVEAHSSLVGADIAIAELLRHFPVALLRAC